MPRPFEPIGRFLRDLKRRNVYKVAVAYLAVAFVSLQAVNLLIPATTLPGWADELLLALLIAGWPGVSLRYLYPRALGPLRTEPRYERVIGEIDRSWGIDPEGAR